MSEISPSSKGRSPFASQPVNPQEADNVTPPLDFDTWDAQIGSGIPDREQKWRSYANYHRMHWFDQGTLTEAVEGNINASLKRHLLEEGFIDEETPNSEIFKPNPISLDKQTNLVTRAFGENVASAWKQGKENGESEEVLNKTLNDAKSFLVDVGELPFASLSNLDGSRQIIGGTSVMNPVSAFENAVRDGAVSYEDAILVQSGLQQGSDIGANRFKDQRRSRLLNEVQNLISDEVGNDQARENFDALSDLLIREDQGRSAKEELHGGMYVKKDRNFFNKLLREQLAEQYSKDKDVNLNLASKRFSDEEIRSVIEEQAALRANLSGEFEYFSEDADLTRNIRVYGTAAVAHPQLMLQPTRFEEALEKDTRLTDKQKDSLRNQRDFYKRQRYESVNNILKETKATSEKWIAASAQGAQAGEDPVETLDKFLSNKDNYDAFKNQSTSILASIGDSFASLYNIPAALLFKSEDAARRLGEAAQEESRRREVAKLFNQEYGLGMDVMTMVAPVLVDIGATAALSMTTMGAGGAAYIGLKTGTTLTSKGFAKGMLGGVLRTASKKDFLEKTVDAGLGYSRVLDPREVAVRELAEKNLKEKLIRSTSEKNAIEAINVYNQMLDNKLLMSSKTFGSLFVTSANRSAGGMFTTIYNSMPEDMSHDEKYDAAIGSALLAGTVTGLITTAFMKLGRGGLEEAFLDGMTFRQMKGVMDRQLGVKLGDTKSNEVAEKFLKKKMRRALGNSPIIEGTLSEAIEEGIDELAQTFIRDAALNEDTPLKEIAAGVGHSMLLGGIFGGGATGARALYNKLGGPTGDEARYRAQVADEIIERLKEEGAPATADEFEIQETRRLLTAPQREVGERRRRRPEETPEAPEPAPAPQAEQEDEVVETTEDEVEEEGASPEDQTEFDFTTGLSPEQFQFRFDTSVEGTDPNRRVEEEQLEIDLDLTSRPVTTTNLLGETEILQEGDPVQTEFSTEDFVNLLDENISPETVSEALTEQLEDRADTLDKPSSGVANEAAKQKVKTKKIYPEERKLQQLISRLNESTSIIKGQEYVFPTADIPIAKEEFIDDHLTATEVKAFEDLIRKGVPVDLTQDRAVHGMPDRSMFPKGYYENKSQLLNELIELRYPKRSSFLPQDVKNPVKDNGKVIGYLDSDGNALFENDPVKAAKLLLMGYSIKAPISKADLNPAFIYKEGSDLIEGVLIDGGFSGNKRVNKNSINEVFPSVADNLSSNTEVLNLFSNNERGVVVGTRPLGEGTELRSNFRKKGTAQSKEQPISEVRQQITDFFKAVRENPEGKVEALNLLKSPKAQDVLESDFSEQAILALEQEFNMVAVLHELNTTLRETEGAVEINEDTGVATPTKRGIDVFKSRLASSDPDAIEKAASVLKINLATSETKSDKVILEFLSDYVLNDPLLQKDSISFREVGLRVFNRFNSFQTNYKDAEGKFYPKDTQTRRYVRLVDPSVAATFDPSAVNFMNDLVLDAASVLEEDQSLRDSVNAYLDLTTALDDVDGRPDWRTGVMSGNEALGLLIDQGATLRSLDPSSEHGKAFLALYKKSLRGKDSRPLHTLLRLISGTTDSVSKEGDITKDLALLEDVRARVEATLGQSFSTPKTIAVISAIRKSSAEAHTTTHYAFGEQATPDVPTATESVSDITSRTIDDLRKLQNVGKSVGSVEQGVEEVWPPRSTSDPDILRTELTPANQKRLDNQEVDKGEADKPIEVESDNTLTVDESNILRRLINRMSAFVRRNGLTLTVINETGVGLAAARARTNDVFINQQAVANLIKQGKSESVIRRILNSILGEEIAHVASYRAISQEQLNKLIDQTTDAEFESIVDEYVTDNPVKNEQYKAALNSENEATVQQTKEKLIEEKLRMYAQERMTGTTSEANYIFWTGDPSKLQIALEYLRRMVSRLLNLKKKGNTTPEMDMAVSNLVEEINVLIGMERFGTGNFAFNPNAPDDYIAGIQNTTLGEIFPEEANATDSPLYELGFNDDLRIGTARLGTKDKPRPTSAESNIGGDLGINDPEPEKAVASLRKTIGNQINKIAQANEAGTPTSRYVLPKEFMEESDPIRRAEILRDWSSDNLKALYNVVPPEVRERSKRWYQGANRVANSLSKKYNITPQQVAGVMAALSPQKDWFLNLAQAEQVIEVWSNYQNYRMDSASFLATIEETVAKATAPKAQLQGKPKKVKDQLNAQARAERAKILNKLKGKRFKDLTETAQRGWAARLIAETLFGKGVSNVDPEGDPNSPYMNVDGDLKTNAWGSSDETAKALSMLDDGSLENISEALGNYHKVRNFYNNIVSPNSLKGDVTIDTHAVAAAFLMPYSTKAIAVKHNFGEGSSQNNVYGMQGTYHIYVDAYRKAAKELGISPYQLQSITWEAIRAMYPKNVRSDLNYVESRENIWKQNDPEQARNRILGQEIPRPLWLGTPDSGLVERAEAQVGTGAQKRTIARRGLFFAGRRATSRLSDYGSPEFEDTGVLRSELGADNKQYRKLILTGDSGTSNLEDLLNSKEVEQALDVSVLNEEDNTRAKVQILDAWIAENGQTIAELNSLVKKAAEAKGYDTDIVYYHGSPVYNIDTPQSRHNSIAAFVSEDRVDAQQIAAIAQQVSAEDIIVHRWYLKRDLKLFDHENDSEVDEVINKLKQEDEVKAAIKRGDFNEPMLRSKIKQGVYSVFTHYDVTNMEYISEYNILNLAEYLRKFGYGGYYERETVPDAEVAPQYSRSLAIFEPNNIKSAESIAFKQSLNAIEDRRDGSLRYETQVVPLDLRFDEGRTELMFTSLGITGAPIEAGPETDRILDTSAKDAAIRAQGKLDDMGLSRSFLDEIPEFEANYDALKSILSDTRDQIGDTSREEMPIVQPQQVEEFGTFLSESLERPVSVEQKEVPVADMKPYQTELFFPKTVWYAMQKHFNMQEATDKVLQEPFSIMSSDGFILDGNHRYGQIMLTRPDASVTANVVDLTIAELIPLAQTFSDMKGNNRKIDRGGQELRLADIGPFDIDALNLNKGVTKGKVVKTGIYMFKSDTLTELAKQEQENFNFGSNNFVPLAEEDIHITLLNQAFVQSREAEGKTDILGEAFRRLGESTTAVLPNLTFHAPEIVSQIQPDGTLRQSLVRRVVEQEVLNNFVEKYILGEPSPDKQRIYHITLGNLTGNPRDSVAYPNPSNSVVVGSKEHFNRSLKDADYSVPQTKKLIEAEAIRNNHLVEGDLVRVFNGAESEGVKSVGDYKRRNIGGGFGFYFKADDSKLSEIDKGKEGQMYDVFLKANKVFTTPRRAMEGIGNNEVFFNELVKGLRTKYKLTNEEANLLRVNETPVMYLAQAQMFDTMVNDLAKVNPKFQKIKEDIDAVGEGGVTKLVSQLSGYDAIHYEGSGTWVVFDPSQIRIAETTREDLIDMTTLRSELGGNQFETLEDGRLVGYRVSRLVDGRAVSGADSRQSTPLEGPIKMTNGFFISNRKDYVLKYYAGNDVNVVQKIAFDKKDILSGNLTDRQPELRVAAGESLESETLTEEQVEELLYSELGATDREYLKLAENPKKNEKALQKMVDTAAKNAGYKIGPVYHGTASEFTVFGNRGKLTKARSALKAFFFTDDLATAKGYAQYAAEEGPIKDALDEAEKAEAKGDWNAYDKAIAKAESLDVPDVTFKRRQKARVVQTFLKGNFLDFDAEGKSPQELFGADGDIDSGLEAQIDIAIREGKEGVRFLNLDDAVGLYDRPSTHYAVFKPEQIKSADPVTYDSTGEVIPLSQRFDTTKDSILYSELGATDKTISGYTYSAGGITVDSLEKMLEAPVYEDGVYDSEKRKDSWWRKFKVAMTGALDIRVRRMFEQREAFNRAVQNDVNLRSIELRKILDKDFIDKGFSIPYELISEATGSSKVVSIPDDIKESMKLQHKSRKADIIARAKRKEITEEEKKTLLEDATNKYKNDIRKQEDVQKEIIRKKKDAALTQLEKVSPDFVNELKAIRDIVDTLSIKLKELYNVDVDLSATIDSNLGIYITRSYKMFNEAGWLDKVTKDPKFSTVRDNAAKYFADTYKQARIKAFIKDGKEESEATALAEKELSDNKDLGRSMMLSFLHSYKDKEASNLIAGPEAVESFASPLINQLKKKRDIDESIRALLGEETDEGAGFKNLLRTYLSVGMMASNQAFMKNLLDVGRRKGNEWILTKDELKKKRLENIDEYGGSRYKQIRAGGTEAYDPFRNFEVEVDGEPKNVQLFAPAEMVDGLMSVLSPPSQETANDAEKIASGSFKLMARITGLSLGAKTLGNIGFYVRNVISNAFYFGPANGFVGFGKMTDSLMTELNRRGIRQEKANTYYTELIALDVIGNEIRPKLIEELLSGQTSPETVLNDFEKNLSRLENEEGKSISRKGKELAQKANEKTWGKAKELSAIVDAFYKIALFEHELSYLIDARESSRKNGKQDFYAAKTDYELKRLAAEKVVMTSQTYSQAPPIITGLQGHTFGVMFAPFLRFKGEVIRTYFNTWNLAMKESKDSNPVIRKRGRRRLAGIGFVTGVSSVILPITTRLLQGIFYDDDEALRDTLPPYMQNQSLVYYTNPLTKERRNFSLTFINPYSMLTDPSLRAMEHLVHGNTSKTVESLVKGTLGEFLDQQIFMRAFLNSTTNFDPKKQEPIYEENDLLHDKFTKSIKYVLNEAYTPPTLTKLLEDRAIFKDGFDITKAPEIISNIIGQFKPATTYPIEFDVRLSEFVAKRKGEFDRINSNKYKMLTDRVMTKADITSLAKKEIEGRRRVNAHLIQLYRSFERQGLPREEIYNISLRRGMSKRRVQLLLAKGLMDRPSLPMPLIESMARKGETHIQRLRDFQAELNKYPRFLSVEP
jgi:hypothetical protein